MVSGQPGTSHHTLRRWVEQVPAAAAAHDRGWPRADGTQGTAQGFTAAAGTGRTGCR